MAATSGLSRPKGHQHDLAALISAAFRAEAAVQKLNERQDIDLVFSHRHAWHEWVSITDEPIEFVAEPRHARPSPAPIRKFLDLRCEQLLSLRILQESLLASRIKAAVTAQQNHHFVDNIGAQVCSHVVDVVRWADCIDVNRDDVEAC